MLNTWGLVFGLIGLISAVAIAVIRSRRVDVKKSEKPFKPLANTEAIYNLSEYKTAKRKYHRMLVLLVFVLLAGIGATSVLAARPASVEVAKPLYENRDIMLCLDTSGSMSSYITDILKYYSDAIKSFEGQRIGLTIFDGVYMTISPLSDDYDVLSEMLLDFSENPLDYFGALFSVEQSTSEIGAGLVGCVNSFDKLGSEDRSRSIIFSTDNIAADDQVVSLLEAAQYAKQYGITVYGMSTSDFRPQAVIDSGESASNSPTREFQESMLLTGGAYYSIAKRAEGEVAVEDIAKNIMEQAAALYEGADTLVYKDSPLIPTIIMLTCMGLFFFMIWRLGL